MTKGFNVYRNDVFVKFIDGRSQASIKRYLNKQVIGTHMAEWRRVLTIAPENVKLTAFEWQYNTTIGAYYLFRPALL